MYISYTHKEKLGRELGKGRQRRLSWMTSSIGMHYA
jgi:hypothetical protein